MIEFDARKYLLDELDRNFRESVANRNFLWDNYWEGRRMVTVPENRSGDVTITGNTFTNTGGRLFPSFPNLAPKNVQPVEDAMKQNPLIPPFQSYPRAPEPKMVMRGNIFVDEWRRVIRACIARLKAARDKDSTNRNLSTLLAVVVKVQKDLETLVGESPERDVPAPRSNETGVTGNDWQRSDAAAESQVTRDDRSL